MNNVVEVLDKVEHAEDQVLVALVRVSRSARVVSRVIAAAKQELQGEDEQAVLNALDAVAQKFLAIVGER